MSQFCAADACRVKVVVALFCCRWCVFRGKSSWWLWSTHGFHSNEKWDLRYWGESRNNIIFCFHTWNESFIFWCWDHSVANISYHFHLKSLLFVFCIRYVKLTKLAVTWTHNCAMRGMGVFLILGRKLCCIQVFKRLLHCNKRLWHKIENIEPCLWQLDPGSVYNYLTYLAWHTKSKISTYKYFIPRKQFWNWFIHLHFG